MPVNWLTAADRDRLLRFPQNISETDLISFFTLTKEDQRFVKRHFSALADYGRRKRTRSDHAGEIERYLGFRQQLCQE